MHVKFIDIYNKAYAEIVNYTPSFYVTKDMVIERFAELIVRECAQVGDSGDSLQDGGIARMIKKHFGVV